MSDHPAYRALTLLYPRQFRVHYRDDLIQHHADLVRSRGRFAAWVRTGLDLVITVPRYHLETTMNQRHATNTLNATVAALVVAGLMAIIIVDSYVGAVLLALAAIIGVTQRSNLAQALRVSDSDRRHHRFKMAAFFALVAAADTAIGFADLANDDSWGTRAVIYGAISYAAGGAAICYLIAGILTRKTPRRPLAKPALH